ncbi:MAG: ABC transporter ATP-binding protein, partial [Actinomycetota bacterium]
MSLDVAVTARRNGFKVGAAFHAEDGDTVALLGPNGAGKSTMVSVLAGLLSPERARVALDGEMLDDTDSGVHLAAERRSIGILHQDLLLLPHLSALENVAFPHRARGAPRALARRRARDALALVEGEHLAEARPATLSGGEAQRVALARALIIKPRLLLLDEPLTGLDVSARTRIRSLLRRVLTGFDGVAIIVTHDPVDAMTLADRIVVIEDGRMTQTGTPAELRSAPRTRYAADLVGVNLFAGRLALDEGIAVIRTAEGDVFCDAPEGTTEAVEGAMGIVRPADVSLFLERPAGSARNLFPGPI